MKWKSKLKSAKKILNTPVSNLIESGIEKLAEMSRSHNQIIVSENPLPLLFDAKENGELTEKAEAAFEKLSGYEKPINNHSLLRKAATACMTVLAGGIALAGCGGSSGQSLQTPYIGPVNPNPSPPPVNPPQPPAPKVSIDNSSLDNAVAGDFYQMQINATSPKGDPILFYLIQFPEGMQIDAETGVLTWSPRYSKLADAKGSQTGAFDVVIGADDGSSSIEKRFVLVSGDNANTYGAEYMKTIINNNTTKILRCGDNSHNCPVNESYLDKKFVGIDGITNDMLEKSGVYIKTTEIDPNANQVEFDVSQHGVGDEVCQQISGEWGLAQMIQRPDIEGRRMLVCLFKYVNPDGSGFDAVGSSPEAKYANETEAHEFFHTLTQFRIIKGYDINSSIFDESFASAMGQLVSGCENPYVPEANAVKPTSFCQLPIYYDESNNPMQALAILLCKQDGFDIANVPAMMQSIDQQIQELGWGVLPIRKVKCITDSITGKATDQEYLDSGITDITSGYCGQ